MGTTKVVSMLGCALRNESPRTAGLIGSFPDRQPFVPALQCDSSARDPNEHWGGSSKEDLLGVATASNDRTWRSASRRFADFVFQTDIETPCSIQEQPLSSRK